MIGSTIALTAVVLACGAVWSSAGAQGVGGGTTTIADAATTTTLAAEQSKQLERGRQVFTTNCVACHQAGGVGKPGTFPPLVGNEHVQDADYVRGVLANGKMGPLVVNGETYDGKMPVFGTLQKEEVDALIAYMQSGFKGGAPAAPAAPAATVLPSETWRNLAWVIVLLGGFFALIAPGLRPVADRTQLTWGAAWSRAAAIVVGSVVLTVVVPSYLLQSDNVANASRVTQDLVGTGLWVAGLAVVLVVLYRLHRGRQL